MRTLSFVLIVPALGIVTAMPQEPSAAQPYEEPDAYQIYSLLLPQEESYGFAKGTLIIQEETVASEAVVAACLDPEGARRFKYAASDYERARTKKRLLQRQFKIDKPYEIVDSKTIARFEASDQPRPKSGGHIFMSPVGFNREKTLAVVYTGSICGGLCGRSKFHLLEKVHGQWREVSGVTCVTVS
ncbi:MAG: hypothetical protein WCA27_07555 [Candidatus Sulfotelmatobacter sp.]